MADWRFVGQAVRRRMGAPMAHRHGSVDKTGGAVDQNADMMASLNSMVQGARAPIGPDVASAVIGNLSGNPSHNPDMVRAKYQMQLSDPALGGAGARTPITNNSTERYGASFGIKMNFAPVIEHAAGATQASGRIIPSSFPRSDAAFAAGTSA